MTDRNPGIKRITNVDPVVGGMITPDESGHVTAASGSLLQGSPDVLLALENVLRRRLLGVAGKSGKKVRGNRACSSELASV